jgi:hypothetical protein
LPRVGIRTADGSSRKKNEHQFSEGITINIRISIRDSPLGVSGVKWSIDSSFLFSVTHRCREAKNERTCGKI